MSIRTQRVYALDHAASRIEGDGCARFLIDRAWPKGLPRDAIAPPAWLRDAAPSEPLTRWFSNDAARWEEFLRRYHAELDDRPEVWAPIAAAAERGPVVLLHGARDEEHNVAAALKRYLDARLRRKAPLARGRESVRPPPSRRSASAR